MRINNFDDVRNSRFLRSLKKTAEKFDLECCYVNIEGIPGCEGVYFFCGTDVNSYLDTKEDVEAVIKRSSLNDCFLLKAKAFKLNGADDFVAHQHIMIYMQNSELLQRIYKEKSLPLPKKVENDAVINIRNLYANLRNTKTAWVKAGLDAQLMKELKGDVYPHAKNGDENFVYDSGKSRFVNYFRRKFGLDATNVSLSHLTAVSASVETVSIKAKYREQIITALNKHPNILYHISKNTGTVVKAKDNEGFGSKEDNDLRHFTLSYNELYKEEVMDIVNRTLYPELCKRTTDELSLEYGELIHFSIPTYEWENTMNLLDTNGVPFTYDTNKYDTFDITLVIPKSYERKLDAVLNRLAIEKQNFKICDFPVINENHFQDAVYENRTEAPLFSPSELFNSLRNIERESTGNLNLDEDRTL